jgi:Flp pilus assembly protein CpaB
VLNLASNQGKIRLSLRNRNHKTVAETTGVTTSVLIGGAAPKNEAAVQPVREEKRVEVIKGLDRSDAKL